MTPAAGPASWLDLKPRDFSTEAPDVQLSMFGPDSQGNLGADLFDLLDDTDGAA